MVEKVLVFNPRVHNASDVEHCTNRALVGGWSISSVYDEGSYTIVLFEADFEDLSDTEQLEWTKRSEIVNA